MVLDWIGKARKGKERKGKERRGEERRGEERKGKEKTTPFGINLREAKYYVGLPSVHDLLYALNSILAKPNANGGHLDR